MARISTDNTEYLVIFIEGVWVDTQYCLFLLLLFYVDLFNECKEGLILNVY